MVCDLKRALVAVRPLVSLAAQAFRIGSLLVSSWMSDLQLNGIERPCDV